MSSKPDSYAWSYGIRTILDELPVSVLTFSARSLIVISLAVADIEDLADGAGFVDQGYHGAHDIADVGEAARLRAVAEHGDRLAGEGLPHEGRDHHPILPGLPRARRY